LFATNGRIAYADVGLMGETVFLYLLDDLKREGLAEDATALEARMKARADRWGQEPYPFGSEVSGVYAVLSLAYHVTRWLGTLLDKRGCMRGELV
jgi:hypothetical protein